MTHALRCLQTRVLPFPGVIKAMSAVLRNTMMSPAEFFVTISLLLPDRQSILQIFGLTIIAGALLTPLEYFAPAHPQRLVFRKELALDLFYWFATPLLSRTITGLLLGTLLFSAAWLAGLTDLSATKMLSGFGPLAFQPHWLQAIEILLLSDFLDYWTHRFLHVGSLWRIHAIHHSPEEMNWLSSSRVHPVNDLITRSCQVLPLIALGFSGTAILNVVPFIAFYVMFLHSNVRWDFGPFRWLLVSPAYHRWHHTSDREGLDKNFAGIFPLWDLIFGTAHFPRRLPQRYGLAGPQLPESLKAHLFFPFTRKKKRSSGKKQVSTLSPAL